MAVVQRPKSWGARIESKGKQVWIGSFPTREEAEDACEQARVERGFVQRESTGPKPPAPPQIIYAVQCGADGPIKIGICLVDRLESRLKNLQTACPYELRTLGTRAGTRSYEMELHRRFQAAHLRGEWFHPVKEIIEFVEGAVAPAVA